MNEMAVKNGMYDEVPEVNQLNRVDGFDPRRYMRLIQNEGQPGKYYLDVAFRKLWFRLKYPNGKIVKKLIKLTDDVAIVEAKVYLDKNDAEDTFISNALAQKYKSGDDQFGMKFVELAETAAVGRALSDAGFGLQFADKEMDFDPEVTEAPIEGPMLNGGSMVSEYDNEELICESDGADALDNPDDSIPGQCEIEDYIPMPEEIEVAMQGAMTPVMQQAGNSAVVTQSQPMTQPVNENPQTNSGQNVRPASVPASGSNTPVGRDVSEIKTNLPVDEIYKMLTRDMAASIVIPTGIYRGKTLGQLSIEKPDAVSWYVDKYSGPNNLLRAAAKFLLNAAFAKAG